MEKVSAQVKVPLTAIMQTHGKEILEKNALNLSGVQGMNMSNSGIFVKYSNSLKSLFIYLLALSMLGPNLCILTLSYSKQGSFLE